MRIVLLLSLLALAACRPRVDWEAKWRQEVAYHEETIRIKNAEMALWKLEVENHKEFIQALEKRIKYLEHENKLLKEEIAALKDR